MATAVPKKRRVIIAAVLGVALASLAGLGVAGLIAGTPSTTAQDADDLPPHPAGTLAWQPTPTGRPTSWHDLPVLPATDDPIVYARAVAQALFAWDTMSGLTPHDHSKVILVDADPSGAETPGLARDVDNYLPPAEAWQRLRDYRTRQSVVIETAAVPDSWDRITRESAGQQLADGTVAVTITGTRRRAGIVNGVAESVDEPVRFTVFLACPPAFERCHTLRLSQPGKPLP